MLRRLLRPAAALGAVAATLAFTGSALANPSTPTLGPISPWVCTSSLNVSWSASTPDPGATLLAYRVDLGDLTTGTAGYKYVTALGTPINGLVSGHKYVIRVRALEITSTNHLVFSGTAADTFTRTCLELRQTNEYVAYNPDPGCIMCGLTDIFANDPGMERRLSVATLPVSERVTGLQIEAGGRTIVITG